MLMRDAREVGCRNGMKLCRLPEKAVLGRADEKHRKGADRPIVIRRKDEALRVETREEDWSWRKRPGKMSEIPGRNWRQGPHNPSEGQPGRKKGQIVKKFGVLESAQKRERKEGR